VDIVLYQPEIPQNTGSIGRTCVALGAKLWLVRPTGFRLDAQSLRRAGMDYWQHLSWEAVDDWQHLQQQLDLQQAWLITTAGQRPYWAAPLAAHRPVLVFGSESAGVPESIHAQFGPRRLRIPMAAAARSLNLAVSVGVVAYEAARQMRQGGAASCAAQ
jgi:tRNA (cytidine/uridine-2'-O-)-methyltransferase